jgi:hypothetical protein
MSAPGNSAVLVTLLAIMIICTGYAAGRLHQWYRAAAERDEAYQEGYDTGARSTFSMAARIAAPRRDKAAVRASASVRPPSPESPAASSPSLTAEPFFAPAAVVPPDAGPSDPSPSAPPSTVSSVPSSAIGAEISSSGRHFVPDELVRAATYRLAPDRVARAKVRGAAPPDDSAPEAPGRRLVPKPRSS